MSILALPNYFPSVADINRIKINSSYNCNVPKKMYYLCQDKNKSTGRQMLITDIVSSDKNS